jgi:glucuronate isomerase
LTGCDTGKLGRLSRRASPRRAFFKPIRRDRDRSRPPDRRHGQPVAAPRRKTLRPVRAGKATRPRTLFRAQMLTEMAKMSVDDGLVMQIHPGSRRNHSPAFLRASAATRVSIFPTAPTMCRR